MRGLKSLVLENSMQMWESHRSRGAWIEITFAITGQTSANTSHRSRGAWIEISIPVCASFRSTRRIAHAVRGLKSFDHQYERERKSRIAHAVRGLK